MNDYKALQQEAARLGIKAVGVKKDELEKLVLEAKAQEPKTEEPVPEDANTAIIYNKGHEVRRYTTQDHGQDFAQLAKQFAAKQGYEVRFITVDFNNKCPYCGHQL